MIEELKCGVCKQRYEVVWDEDRKEFTDDWLDEDSEVDDFNSDYESLDQPEYCPFCGSHKDYEE